MRFLYLLALPALLLWTGAVTADDKYAGSWVVNLEETQAVAVPFKKGSGVGGPKWKPQVTVMGLPIPGTQKMPPMSGLAAKDPEVLRCASMIIAPGESRWDIEYPGVGKESLREGHYRGRDTKISRKQIRQKYKTPERRVTKTWSIRPDGRMLVEVKIKYVGDKSRTFRRVFDKKSLEDAALEEAASSG